MILACKTRGKLTDYYEFAILGAKGNGARSGPPPAQLRNLKNTENSFRVTSVSFKKKKSLTLTTNKMARFWLITRTSGIFSTTFSQWLISVMTGMLSVLKVAGIRTVLVACHSMVLRLQISSLQKTRSTQSRWLMTQTFSSRSRNLMAESGRKGSSQSSPTKTDQS